MRPPGLIRNSVVARHLYARSYVLRYLRAPKSDHSFSQAGEDLLVGSVLDNVDFFIDIGAHDGISGSNTFHFALNGARGICFEPIRWTFQKLQSLYALNRKVICRNVGISDVAGEIEMVSADFLSYIPSTVDESHLSMHSPVETKFERIKLLTFPEAIAGVDIPKAIDLLSIDVEGHELNVLRSIPFNQFGFRVIVLETHLEENAKVKWKHRDLDAIESLLCAAGYLRWKTTWVNTIYLNEKLWRAVCGS
jgi:FkbM family methyltransferase